MKNEFIPDYRHIVDAAWNREAKRMPLYEHAVDDSIMETVLSKEVVPLYNGGFSDKVEYFRRRAEFFCHMGYDTVFYDGCIGSIMPGNGSLGGHKKGEIQTMDDFLRYPWQEIPELYFKQYSNDFKALRNSMPSGMKAVGGVGNGIFECVQEIVGYTDLCFISADDPELYKLLFQKVGETNIKIWSMFLTEFSDIFCLLRFGDDLGYKSSTLLSADDIQSFIIPKYKGIIDLVHSYDKPFLFHCCGWIFNIMDELIAIGIDAKHSNEDQIAPFPEWVHRYGDKIGNFGGIDTDAVCRLDEVEMRDYIYNVLDQCNGHGGIAFGSGNSIPKYVPVDQYLTMIDIARKYRGE